MSLVGTIAAHVRWTGMWIPKLRLSAGPTYAAIADAISEDVAARRLQPGDQLPPQRELAAQMNVAVATVTRAYREAARRGLIAGEKGRGSYVLDRDLVRTTLEPASVGLIDLGPSWPIYAEDPDLRQALRALARRPSLQRLLRYQPHVGLTSHRQAGVTWMARYGIDVAADKVAVTAGVQHAIVTALGCSAAPGDVVLTEALTYPGVKAAAALLHVDLHGVPMDEKGIIPSSLERTIRRTGAKVLYTVATMHNPTTATLGDDRRKEVVAIARRRNLTIIEDDVHRPLVGKSPMAFVSLAPERTYHIAGLSKSVTGALRVAYLAYPDSQATVVERLWATNWMASPITAEIAAMWIDDGTAEKVVRSKIAEAGRRHLLAEKRLAGWTWQNDRAAPHFWLHLPPGISATAFTRASLTAGVVVTPAEAFAVRGTDIPSAVRLSLSAPDTREELDTALTRLAQILSARGDGPRSTM